MIRHVIGVTAWLIGGAILVLMWHTYERLGVIQSMLSGGCL